MVVVCAAVAGVGTTGAGGDAGFAAAVVVGKVDVTAVIVSDFGGAVVIIAGPAFVPTLVSAFVLSGVGIVVVVTVVVGSTAGEPVGRAPQATITIISAVASRSKIAVFFMFLHLVLTYIVCVPFACRSAQMLNSALPAAFAWLSFARIACCVAPGSASPPWVSWGR